MNMPRPRHSQVENNILGGDLSYGYSLVSKMIFLNPTYTNRLRKAFSEYIKRGGCKSRGLNIDKHSPQDADVRVLVNMVELHLRWPVDSIVSHF